MYARLVSHRLICWILEISDGVPFRLFCRWLCVVQCATPLIHWLDTPVLSIACVARKTISFNCTSENTHCNTDQTHSPSNSAHVESQIFPLWFTIASTLLLKVSTMKHCLTICICCIATETYSTNLMCKQNCYLCCACMLHIISL